MVVIGECGKTKENRWMHNFLWNVHSVSWMKNANRLHWKGCSATFNCPLKDRAMWKKWFMPNGPIWSLRLGIHDLLAQSSNVSRSLNEFWHFREEWFFLVSPVIYVSFGCFRHISFNYKLKYIFVYKKARLAYNWTTTIRWKPLNKTFISVNIAK